MRKLLFFFVVLGSIPVYAMYLDDWYPLHDAIGRIDLAAVKALIQQGADLNRQDPQNRIPLFMAIEAHNFDISQALISAKAEVNIQGPKGETALGSVLTHITNEDDRYALCSALIGAGADPQHMSDGFHAYKDDMIKLKKEIDAQKSCCARLRKQRCVIL